MKKKIRIGTIIITSVVLLSLLALFFPRRVGNIISSKGTPGNFTIDDAPYPGIGDQTVITMQLTKEQSEQLLDILSRCYVRPTLRSDSFPLSGFFPVKTEGEYLGYTLYPSNLNVPFVYIATRNNITINGTHYVIYNPSVIDEIIQMIDDINWGSC
jgi:hypothetical protein